MDQPIVAALIRNKTGKEAARKLRKENKLPAVFYGPKIDPVPLTVEMNELEKILKHGSIESTLINLKITSGEGEKTYSTIIKDLTVDPIKNTIIHADFYEISMDKEITVDLSIHLEGTPAGAADGGILQQITREISISCLPDKLIESITVDVSELEIGDALHIEDIDLPEGVNTNEEEGLTIAVVAAPTVQEEKVEEELEGAEEATTEEAPEKEEQ